MANLTLVIDDDVLRRARVKALEQGTSVNAVVRRQIEQYAADHGPESGMHGFLEGARRSRCRAGPAGEPGAVMPPTTAKAFMDTSVLATGAVVAGVSIENPFN